MRHRFSSFSPVFSSERASSSTPERERKTNHPFGIESCHSHSSPSSFLFLDVFRPISLPPSPSSPLSPRLLEFQSFCQQKLRQRRKGWGGKGERGKGRVEDFVRRQQPQKLYSSRCANARSKSVLFEKIVRVTSLRKERHMREKSLFCETCNIVNFF